MLDDDDADDDDDGDDNNDDDGIKSVFMPLVHNWWLSLLFI